jgi:peptide/nickel transport system substrate-binding protein
MGSALTRLQAGGFSIGIEAPLDNDWTPLGEQARRAARRLPGEPDLQRHAELARLADRLGFRALWVRDVPVYDPAFGDDGESAKVICNVYEGLVRYKPDSTEVEPCLATEWKMSPDGKEWTFTLRQGVKFQDGSDFDAAAVKFSVDRQLPPQRTDAMPYASFTFGPVKEVQVVDKYTVKFVLTEPYAPFLANLAMALAAPIVSPTAVKKSGEDFNNNPVGTGPYKFVKWTKGQMIELTAWEGYWGDQPKTKKVVFKITKENSVRASELITGADDIIDGVDPNDVKKLEESKMLSGIDPEKVFIVFGEEEAVEGTFEIEVYAEA